MLPTLMGLNPATWFGMFRQSACGWPTAEPAPYWRSTLRIERSARRFKGPPPSPKYPCCPKVPWWSLSNPQPANCISWPQTQALPRPCCDPIDIGRHVVDITFDADGHQLFVLHRWRHQATLWKTEGADKLNFHLSKKIDLPFAPLTQVVDEARDRWIIGAAFGGELLALNAPSGEVLNSHNRPIHNIRDMALSPDGQHLWLTHQHLYPEGTTLKVISNGVFSWKTVFVHGHQRFA